MKPETRFTPQKMLNVMELVFGIIAISCISTQDKRYIEASWTFYVAVCGIGLIVTYHSLLLISLVKPVTKRKETVINGVICVFYLTSSIFITVAYSENTDYRVRSEYRGYIHRVFWIEVGVAFGYINSLAYGASAFLASISDAGVVAATGEMQQKIGTESAESIELKIVSGVIHALQPFGGSFDASCSLENENIRTLDLKIRVPHNSLKPSTSVIPGSEQDLQNQSLYPNLPKVTYNPDAVHGSLACSCIENEPYYTNCESPAPSAPHRFVIPSTDVDK